MFGWLAAAALLLTTACSDNVALDVAQGDTNGANTVTFTIMPQSQKLGTRADGDIDTRNKYISDGSKADVLIFAVYKKEADGTWVPDQEFCKGDQTGGLLPNGALGEAQNAIKVNKYPVTIQLYVTNYEAEYKVAFWAQNHETTAYDTKKLHRVKVSYKDAENNDELRDAFCAVTEKPFSGATKETQTVTLRRPLAQVNIGTAGWDYEGAAHLKPSPVSYIYSQVKLGGVAQYYDIINETALNQEALNAEIAAHPEDFDEDANADDHKAKIDVTFDFNRIPAFVQAEQSEWSTQYTPVENEEYLQVDVNRNGKIDGYTKNKYVGWEDYEKYRKGEYNENAEDNEDSEEEGEDPDEKISTKDLFNEGIMPETEMYKYLSMCYVLVPEAEGETGGDAEGDVAGAAEEEGEEEGEANAPQQVNSVLSFVEFEAKGIKISEKDEDADNAADDPTADDEAIDNTLKTVFKINNVPVSKNWRTNIVGNNFFTAVTKFHLDIVPEYCGDYNYNGWEYGPAKGDDNLSWPGEGSHTYSLSFTSSSFTQKSDDPNFSSPFTISGTLGETSYGTGTYNGTSYPAALKMNSSGYIKFKTKSRSLVTIVQTDQMFVSKVLTKGQGRIQIDGIELPASSATQPQGSSGIYLYTVSVPAGDHEILKVPGTYEFGIYYVEVNTSFVIDDKTIYKNVFVIGEDENGEDENGDFDQKYPDYKGDGDE